MKSQMWLHLFLGYLCQLDMSLWKMESQLKFRHQSFWMVFYVISLENYCLAFFSQFHDSKEKCLTDLFNKLINCTLIRQTPAGILIKFMTLRIYLRIFLYQFSIVIFIVYFIYFWFLFWYLNISLIHVEFNLNPQHTKKRKSINNTHMCYPQSMRF